MKYATPRDFRMAIDARLKAYAKESDPRALVQMRKHIAFERFLARLFAVSPDAWLVKGGTALQYRLKQASRYTKDLDLVLAASAEVATKAVLEAVAFQANDYFAITPQRSRPLDHGAEGASLRFTLRVDLDGRMFENIIVDIGFDEPPPIRPDIVAGSNFLEFADIPTLAVPILPIEIHLAEKLHAFARIYEGDRQSTRVKDLIDIVLIAKAYPLRADHVLLALDHTFGTRATQPLPAKLGAPPHDWTVPYGTLTKSVGLDPDIAAGHAFAASLLDPLLGGGSAETAIWTPESGEWRVH